MVRLPPQLARPEHDRRSTSPHVAEHPHEADADERADHLAMSKPHDTASLIVFRSLPMEDRAREVLLNENGYRSRLWDFSTNANLILWCGTATLAAVDFRPQGRSLLPLGQSVALSAQFVQQNAPRRQENHEREAGEKASAHGAMHSVAVTVHGRQLKVS